MLESPDLDLPDNVVIVDTPGMGEGPARDEISRQSARRCQAVVLVLSASQLGAQTERQAVQALADEVRKVLVIAINRGDEVKPDSYPGLCDRAASLFSVSADRVQIVSARDGQKSDLWAARLQGLWKCIHDNLLVKSRILRTRLLMPRLKPVIVAARAALERVEIDERDQDEVSKLAADLDQRLNLATTVRKEIGDGVDLNRLRSSIISKTRTLIAARLREIRQELVQEQTWGKWSSEKSRLFNPKGHLSDLLTQAQGFIVDRLTHWSKEVLPGADLLT